MRHSESSKVVRRSVLKSATCTLSLPLLASLRNRPFLQSVGAVEPAREDNPKRFCCIFFPNGVGLPPKEHASHADWHWFPHGEGNEFEFTKSLEPLATHRQELSILSGLSHPAMRSSIAHITADSFLTGADSSRFYTNSISLDQVIARQVGEQTRFPSLALSSDGGVGTPGRTRTLSFNAAGQPIPSLSSPRAIYDRLFGLKTKSVSDQRREFGKSRSVLDHVLEEVDTLRRGLSHSDKQSFEEYATSVREVEKRLESADRWLETRRPEVSSDQLNLVASPEGDAADYIRSILDLIYIAFVTDSTRTITYQITSEDAKGIGDTFPQSIGLPNHHALSHGTEKKNGYEQWGQYDRFLATQFAYFLDRMRRTQDPVQDGSLLDNSLVLYGSSTSRTHLARNYPLVLAGGKRLGLKHGRLKNFDEDRYRMSDLYVAFLECLSLNIDRFADSTTSLREFLTT